MSTHTFSFGALPAFTRRFLLSLLLLGWAHGAGGQVVGTIRSQGDQLLLEWVDEQPGFLFEQTEMLGDAADWRPLPFYPVVEPSGAFALAIDPGRPQRFFRLREDVLPAAVHRTPVQLGIERISWDFTYRVAQLEYSEDTGSTWSPLAATPSIDFETGEFYVEQPVPAASRAYRLRINRPPAPGGPATQTVAIGEQWAFSFPTRDPDGDWIRYTVEGLPAGARFDPTTATLTFKPEPDGAGSHVVRLTAADATAAVTQELTLTVPAAPPRTTTALSGVVLDAHAGAVGRTLPIVGVKVTLLNTGAKTVTDSQGVFAFEDVPGGLQVLNFDPTEALPGPDGAVYAGFREEYTLLPKIANRISRPVYLPRLAGESLTEVVTSRTTIVENTAIGVRLTIPPDTAMAGGTVPFTNALSISEVPRGFEPAAMPSSLQPDLLITIQPVGVTFSQPVAITFPNRSGYEVGTEVEIWSLDAGTGQFVVVGVGRVSVDGQRIDTISGGVRATDWHFAAPAPPNGGPAADSEGGSNKCPAGSEFTLNNGEMTTAFESPEWFSHGERRTLRFVYSSRQAYPGITTPIELIMPARVPTPKSIAVSALLPDQGAVLPPVWLSGADMRGGNARRTTVHVPAADVPTGVHSVSVETMSRWAANLGSASDARRGGAFDVQTAVVNRMRSPYGMGWSVDGLQSIHVNPRLPGVALLVEGTQSHVFDRLADPRSVPVFRYGDAIELPERFLAGSGSLGDPVTADFDGDGILDLALRHVANASTVLILQGRGDGTFELLHEIVVSPNPVTQMIGIDLDRNGFTDLAMVSRRTALESRSQLHVLKGLGGAAFSGPDNYAIDTLGVGSLAAGDIDGNGTLDLVAARGGGGVVGFLGRGDGTFAASTPSTLSSAQCPDSILLADLNGDNRADLIGERDSAVYAALSLGAGDFTHASSFATRALSLQIGDFVEGGPPEVLVAGQSLRLLEWQAGNFVDRGIMELLPIAAQDQAPVHARDIDGDGHVDAVMHTVHNQLLVAYGDGLGGFAADFYVSHPASVAPNGGNRLPDAPNDGAAVVAADFNRDGVQDLLSVVDFDSFNGAVVIEGKGPRRFATPQYSGGGPVESSTAPFESPILAVAGDFDNDGTNDVLYASRPHPFIFHAGRGDGTMADGTIALAEGQGRRNQGASLAAADFDRDGNLDILYPAAHSSRRITTVQWGLGNGTFAVNPAAGLENGWVGNETTSGILQASVAVGDVNADGYPDYVVAHRTTTPSVWLYNPASPRTFTGPTPLNDVSGFDFAPLVAGGDLNGDGLLDVVCFERSFDSDSRSLFFAAFVSRGDGTFRRVVPDFGGFTQGFEGGGIPFTYDIDGAAIEPHIADLNRDGKADLVFSHPNGVWFMSGDGTGVLSAPRLVSGYSGRTEAISLADLTGDGAPEAIVNLRGQGTLVLPNVGGRQIFGPAVPIAAGYSQPSRYLGLHANGDRKLDLVVVNPFILSEHWPLTTLLNVLPSGGFETPEATIEPVVYASPAGDFSTLTRLADGTWHRRMRDGTQHFFDALGRQVSTRDRRGRTTRFSYLGNSDRLERIGDAAGRETLLTYRDGVLLSVSTPAGVLQMRYEETFPGSSPRYGLPAPGPRLTSVVLPGGAIRRFTYSVLPTVAIR